MKLHVWKNDDGLHLRRPSRPSRLVDIDFDPDQQCRRCGERVLSISADQSNICPWCESGMNRPKMLRYQELDLVRLLKKQSDCNRLGKTRERRLLIRNGGTEKDLRDCLTGQGYFGRSARILQLDLTAIERPGWVQVFEFHVQAKRVNGDWDELKGICRTDERSNLFDVTYFDSASRDEILRLSTEGLITGRRGPRHWSFWPLMMLFAILLGLAIIGAINAPGRPSDTVISVPGET